MKLTTTQITAFMEYLGINPEDRPTIENLRKIVQTSSKSFHFKI